MNRSLEIILLRFLVSFLLIGSIVMTIIYICFSPNSSILGTVINVVINIICFGVFFNIFKFTSCLYGV
jgi:hypothetical protein